MSHDAKVLLGRGVTVNGKDPKKELRIVATSNNQNGDILAYLMGEGDLNLEQGLEALLLHQTGECDTREPCQYCAEEEQGAEKQAQKERKQARKRATRGSRAIDDGAG